MSSEKISLNQIYGTSVAHLATVQEDLGSMPTQDDIFWKL